MRCTTTYERAWLTSAAAGSADQDAYDELARRQEEMAGLKAFNPYAVVDRTRRLVQSR